MLGAVGLVGQVAVRRVWDLNGELGRGPIRVTRTTAEENELAFRETPAGAGGQEGGGGTMWLAGQRERDLCHLRCSGLMSL